MATVTPERPHSTESDVATVSGRRTGVVVVAVVIAALLGFGLGWAMFRDTGNDVPDDVQAVLDDYVDAWNDADGDAATALMSPTARFYGEGYTGDEGLSREELVDWIDGVLADQIDVQSTTIVGDGPYVVVMEHSVGNIHGYSVFMLEDMAEQLLILDHVWMTG